MLFVFNPRAGKAKIKSKLCDIIDIFIKAGYEVTAYPTQYEGDAIRVVREKDESYDLLVCSGGDGTLDEVVNGMIQSSKRIPIGYIPAGSTNDFANSLFIPKDMVQAAGMLADGKLYGCDIGKFNQGTFAYIAAFGLFTDVAYETNQDIKNVLGHVAYVLEGMKRLFEIKSYEMTIRSGDLEYDGDYIFGMITNSRSVGGFKHLTGKHVDMNDGLFEVTLIKRPKNPIELQEIIGSLLIAEDNTDLIHSFKTSSISIESKEEVPWTLDGEFGGSHTIVEIRNLHQALKIYLEKREK